MRNGGLASEYGDVAAPTVLRAWGLHVCGPHKRYRRLMAVSGTLFTEHREIDDQRASAAWTGLPPWPMVFTFLNVGGFPRPGFALVCTTRASYC